MNFSGLAAGSAVSIDGTMLTIEAPGEPSWNSGWQSFHRQLLPNQNHLDLNFEIKKAFFQKIKSQAVKARISFALTVFHDKETRRIVATAGEFKVPEVGICWIESQYRTNNVQCRYVYKSPVMIASVAFSEMTCPRSKDDPVPLQTTTYNFTGPIDAGPISPVGEANLFFGAWDISGKPNKTVLSVCPGTSLTFAEQEEVKKVQTEIEINGIKLGDYAFPSGDGGSFAVGIDIH
jgi:hypothetical protein